jgi:hypothetical protein
MFLPKRSKARKKPSPAGAASTTLIATTVPQFSLTSHPSSGPARSEQRQVASSVVTQARLEDDTAGPSAISAGDDEAALPFENSHIEEPGFKPNYETTAACATEEGEKAREVSAKSVTAPRTDFSS